MCYLVVGITNPIIPSLEQTESWVLAEVQSLYPASCGTSIQRFSPTAWCPLALPPPIRAPSSWEAHKTSNSIATWSTHPSSTKRFLHIITWASQESAWTVPCWRISHQTLSTSTKQLMQVASCWTLAAHLPSSTLLLTLLCPRLVSSSALAQTDFKDWAG